MNEICTATGIGEDVRFLDTCIYPLSLFISLLAARTVWGRTRPTRPGNSSRTPERRARISYGSFGS